MKGIGQKLKDEKIIEKIDDPELLEILKKAVRFEEVAAKQPSCFSCGEKFGFGKDTDSKSIPDEWECSKGHLIQAIGWEWSDVSNSWHMVDRLLKMKLCYIKRKSNKHTEYRLYNREHVEETIEFSEGPTSKQETKQKVPLEIFSSIIGYDDIKKLLRRGLSADTPLSILFIGPPASAKTMFQLEIERLPGAMFTVGSNITKSGLTSLLFDNDIRYLIIDEIEDMKAEDVAPLLTLMTTGKLTETKFGRTRSKEMKLSVFASCNSTKRMRPALLSRFLRFTFKEYTYDEFVEITKHVIPVDENYAVSIANAVWNELKSKDIRDVFKIYNLLPDKSEDDLKWVVQTLIRYQV